jgi:tetratricopeptide (TPR) repeat protein/serine phosphatase RsbU (regulator of sigma subunit)
MRLFTYIILFLISFNGVAQNFNADEQHQIDSLNQVIANPNSPDTSLAGAYVALSEILYVSNIDTIFPLCEKAKIIGEKGLANDHSEKTKKSLQSSLAGALNNIGYVIQQKGDIPKALEYYHQSLKIQEEIGDKKGIANSLNNIGMIYKGQGNTPKALEYLHKSLKIREEIGDKRGIAESLNNIGYVYNSQGDIPKALEYYHKSLAIQEEIGDKLGITLSLNNIGSIYDGQGDIPKALEYFHKSLTIQEELGDKKGISRSLNNIGHIYEGQGELQKALEYYHKSLKIREEIVNKEGIATILNNIGGIYVGQGDIPIAFEYYHKSLKIQEELGDKSGMASSLNNIGMLEMKKGALLSAEKYLQRSLKLAREVGSPIQISDASSNLSILSKQQGKHELALQMYELHIQMRDSINNETTQKASAQQEAKYEYEKQKVIDDAAHNKLLAIEQEAKAKQKVITIATGVGLGLVILFLIFVFNRLQVTKKQKLVIEEQRDVVEATHKEIRDSINYAERIQRSFLATDELLNNNLKDYFVFFQPKDVVSGDFYWAGKLANNNFAVVNADSTGHGVPGAIMSILNITSIEKAIDNKLVKPADIFNHTRNTIIERLSKDGSKEGGKDGMDASIISFDFENNKFSYTAAQNPIWVIRHGELIEIKPEKMPIGKHDNDTVPFVGGEFETQKGDIIYTITDGFHDQFGGEKGKKFMVKPFKNYLISIAHLAMQEQKEKLTETFTTWKGEEEQVDDVCVIGVRI